MPNDRLHAITTVFSDQEMDFLGLKNASPAEKSRAVENEVRARFGWPERADEGAIFLRMDLAVMDAVAERAIAERVPLDRYIERVLAAHVAAPAEAE